MKKAFVLFFAALLGVTLVGCESTKHQEPESQTAAKKEAVMESVKGMITYRERIALPSDAVVTIALEDVSLMDAPAKVIAEQTFTTEGAQVPFDFELSYDANEISENHRYSVRAKIVVDGKLRFTTDTSNLVITDSAQTKEVNLMMVGVR